MFKINFDAPAKAQEKPSTDFKIKIATSKLPFASAVVGPISKPTPHRQLTRTEKEETPLAQQAWAEFNALRIEQAQVSNTIYDTVQRDASLAELKDLYVRIESYRPELITLYEKARHVEQYGVLPEVKLVSDPQDIASLKLKRKSLVDARCKLQVKLKKGHLKEAKVLDWQLQLDIANAEYEELDARIKKMEGKA